MKKGNLKSLRFNKKTISNLQTKISGRGTNGLTCHTTSETVFICGPQTIWGTCDCQMTHEANCPSDSDSMVCE